MPEKREAQLKALFSKELKRQLPGFVTLLLATAGAADRAIVGNGITSFWEFKHATPDFKSPGNQELMCLRLVNAGVHCRYVIWWENAHGEGPRTLIVTPEAVHERLGWVMQIEAAAPGFNHHWLVQQVKAAHGL